MVRCSGAHARPGGKGPRGVDSRMVPDEVRTLPCPEQAQ
jgi:hypothetical protein